MAQSSTTQSKALVEAAAYASGWQEDGFGDKEILERLKARGFSPQTAAEILRRVNQARAAKLRTIGFQRVALGLAVWLFAAAMATNTFGMTDTFGTFGYIVAALGIIFTAKPFIRGLHALFIGIWHWE